jgi:DtxR family Mn-dependent transcriptional regulator
LPVLTPSLEDYLKAILILERQRGAARPADIARVVRVGRPSVSLALKRLKGKGMISHNAYGDATLTPEGNKAAKSVLFRHEALSVFFVNVLGVPKDQANENAHRLEHAIDDTVLERLVAFTNTLVERHGPLEGPQGFCKEEAQHYDLYDTSCSSPHEDATQEPLG